MAVKSQLTRLPAMIEPMTARAGAALPDGRRADRYGFEVKADGFRCIAARERGRVRLTSRQQRPLTRSFPEIVAGLLEQVPDATVLDGELVVHHGGRFDFAALQRRHHPSAVHAIRRGALPPAALMVFDVLFLAGVDLRQQPYAARRRQLEQLLGDARAPLVCMPMTRDLAAARAWLHEHTAAGVEGVVVKHLAHAYLPSRRSWTKVRTRCTAEAVVYGVTGPPGQPETLLLALPQPDGNLRAAGQTTVLAPPTRRELGALLTPSGHPHVLGASAWRAGRGPVRYLQVEPTVVVEVDADVCFEHGRWRHPTTFLRWRPDLTRDDLAAPAA